MELNITPHKGIGTIPFGIEESQIVKLIDLPEEKEKIGNASDDETTVLHYPKIGLTLFLEGQPAILHCMDCSNHNATLFGQYPFKMTEKEIVKLMTSNNYYEQDISNEDWGEKRISFPESNIDFFFDNGELVSINLGI